MRQTSSKQRLLAAVAGAMLSTASFGQSTEPADRNHSKLLSGKSTQLIITANDENHSSVREDSRVKANAWHLNGQNGSLSSQVQDFLDAPGFNKPKILSSDGLQLTYADLDNVLRQILPGNTPDGLIHFEHFDRQQSRYKGKIRVIDSNDDFLSGAKSRMSLIGAKATPLMGSGPINVEYDGATGKHRFKWGTQLVRLGGFSLYGMLATTRHDEALYLDMLASRGINFTRVWSIEQWTAFASGTQVGGAPAWITGMTPFVGRNTTSEKYDLYKLRQAYFDHVKTFVQLARARGIVVQITLFDRAGLTYQGVANPNPGSAGDDTWGTFYGSPFNQNNNLFTGVDVDPYLPVPPCTNCEPVDFTGVDGSDIAAVHRSFIQKMVTELSGYGNVIFEIMNEPRTAMTDVANWQLWVADRAQEAHMRGALRVSQQPQSATVTEGQDAVFSASVPGGSATREYQWLAKAPGGDWFELFAGSPFWDGETTKTLTTHPVAAHSGFKVKLRTRDLVYPADGGEVQSDEATLTVNPAASQTMTFPVIDDTFSDQDAPNTSRGALGYMRMRTNTTNLGKNVYMKFTVSGITGTVQSAKLKVRTRAQPINFDVGVYRVNTNSWTEETLTWNNASLNVTLFDTLTGGLPANTWHEIDVTSQITGNGTYSFGLATSANLGALELHSKEETETGPSGSWAPYLEVTFN